MRFLVSIFVSMVDPIAFIAYAIPAWVASTWLGTIIGGAIAGIVMAALRSGLDYLESHSYGVTMSASPDSLQLLFAGFLGCILGACILKGIGKGIRAMKNTPTEK